MFKSYLVELKPKSLTACSAILPAALLVENLTPVMGFLFDFCFFFPAGWINSAINPFIYAFVSQDFRMAFWRLTCSYCTGHKPNPNAATQNRLVIRYSHYSRNQVWRVRDDFKTQPSSTSHDPCVLDGGAARPGGETKTSVGNRDVNWWSASDCT